MSTKNRLDLDKAPISLGEFVDKLPQTCAFRKGELVKVQDFGTVFIGNPPHQDISTPQSGAFVFSAPKEWRMSHLLKALGIFSSSSQAAKNGWGFDIPSGCSSHLVRANKVLGEIWLHKEA